MPKSANVMISLPGSENVNVVTQDPLERDFEVAIRKWENHEITDEELFAKIPDRTPGRYGVRGFLMDVFARF